MKFQRIPKDFLQSIHNGSRNIPTLYFHPNSLVRGLFYKRLETIFELMPDDSEKQNQIICDFGGGGGIFLPTLSRSFKRVVIIDLETREARKIIKKYNLKNIEVFQGDVLSNPFPNNYFDIVVAADVLEHFRNLSRPIKEIYRLLKSKGLLFASSPTENSFYHFGRLLAGLRKPRDHYHDAKEVEKALRKESFIITKKLFLPFQCSPLSLFSILKAEKKTS